MYLKTELSYRQEKQYNVYINKVIHPWPGWVLVLFVNN